MGRPLPSTPEQQKEATRRRAEDATLQELADSYDRSVSTMRRATKIVERLRAIASVVIPNRISYLRNLERRELLLSGLRLAAGEAT